MSYRELQFFSVKVIAQDDDWAVEKIIEVSAVHGKQAHPNLPSMTVQQIKNVVLSGVKKQLGSLIEK